ncbi:MAG: hypothetical protein IJ608_02955 [Lachnospiraceae bacterium]|nr:hypothetical protein [Lachnospiraceae bacterium]
MPTGNELKNDLRIQRDYLEFIKKYLQNDEKENAIEYIDSILKRINESLQD